MLLLKKTLELKTFDFCKGDCSQQHFPPIDWWLISFDPFKWMLCKKNLDLMFVNPIA
jgi:hypothetical protein